MRIYAVLCTVVLLAAQSVATFAQMGMAGSGLYVSLDGGANLVGDASKVKAKRGSTDLKEADTDWSFSFGFGFAGGVGYDFGDFRVDAEVSYLNAGFAVTEAGEDPGTNDPKGGFTLFGGTANVWLDVDTGTAFVPYIGVGGGGGYVSATAPKGLMLPDGDSKLDLSEKVFSGWVFAFQGGAGVVYELTDAIGLELGYRLFGIVNPQLKSTTKIVGDEYVTVSPGLMLTHRVNLGIDVAF
jgi:opacity protein-like surface antigen